MEQAEYEEYCALWAQYVARIKQEFEILKDDYPEAVREAFRILIALGKLIADPSLSKLSCKEAVFSKIPREKIKWAAKIFERWATRDERRAAARERQRQKRQANHGRIEERQLTAKQNDKVYENFESHWLLNPPFRWDVQKYPSWGPVVPEKPGFRLSPE